ncbi:MAG: hypothetical protein EHM23_20645 [Acidobacteria bacterium]|nr:MAG: hypothetical protein EHM23_20645 [Acidobacteriota bacterium]
MKKTAIVFSLILASPVLAEDVSPPIDQTIEGTVVCADEQGSVLPSADTCTVSHSYALRTDQGKVYFFLKQDPRAEIFHDARVRARRLRISGWARQGNRIEIIKLQSVRNGSLYDVYYFCETCNIKALVGGPCPCCQADLEFRETPAETG